MKVSKKKIKDLVLQLLLNCDDQSEGDEDMTTLLSRKFNAFMKKKIISSTKFEKKDEKWKDDKKDKIQYFEC